jgi:hypothetical protein
MVESVNARHEAKLEEVSAQFASQGYTVKRGAEVGDSEFDLVAERSGQRIAIDVKDALELRASTPAIIKSREIAVQKGYQDFRVFVVNPERQKRILVPGLDGTLREILSSPDRARDLYSLAPRIEIRRVHDVDIDSIAMDWGDVHVIGSAVVAAGLNYPDDSAEPISLIAEFPVWFDLRLASDLSLRQVVSLRVDTTSFTGP